MSIYLKDIGANCGPEIVACRYLQQENAEVVGDVLLERMGLFAESSDLEVQERVGVFPLCDIENLLLSFVHGQSSVLGFFVFLTIKCPQTWRCRSG